MWSRRRRISVALAALALLGGACGRRGGPTPAPVGVPVAPLGDEVSTAVAGPALPAALPTWTLGPPGGLVGAPAPGGVAPAAGPGPASGVIPVPTARATVAVGADGPPATDPEIVALIGRVDPGRLAADVNRLAGFGTRNSFSSTEIANRGIGAAREWLMGELTRIGAGSVSQLQTEWEDFPLGSTTQRNVIATLTGIGLQKRLIYLTAHYDSRADNVYDGQAPAPGADDNASGVAALLELARLLGTRQWDASIRLVAFAGEEQGQAGSRYHAPRAQAAGLPIVAVLNSDIIGGTRSAQGAAIADRARVFSAPHDDSASRRLARHAELVARRYGLLALEVVPEDDRLGHGSDHHAFSEAADFAAIRLSEAADYAERWHSGQDLPAGVDPDYLAATTRLNVALVGNLALAPPAVAAAPEVTKLGADALRVTWAPVAADQVAGYYVAWRPAAESAYRDLMWAGTATSFDLTGLPGGPIAVAVIAADDRGHLSLVSPETGTSRGPGG